ncbi:MAG: ABC transporter permease [Lentisphaerae bacterium]|nr:ABC transporter permease [Lentisphaerota bacterium]
MKPEEKVLIIEANRTGMLYLRDFWNYRELFFTLAWRDIVVRYKQTIVGILWTILRPLATMVIFTVVFGKIAKLPSDAGVPYVLMVFGGMLPWQFISGTITMGSDTLVGNRGLISKVYFPRIIIPTARTIMSLVELLINAFLFVLLFIWYRYMPNWHVVFLPVFLLMAVLLALGVTYFISSLNVKYRDFQYVVPFIVQLGLYISPIGFSSAVVPEKWRLLYACNPVVGIIDGIRWCLFDSPLMMESVIAAAVISVAFFLLGIWFFRKTESEFADFI